MYTKRPQNVCPRCGYTWSPRGHSISLSCPNCGSQQVGIAGTPSRIAGTPSIGCGCLSLIAILGYFIYVGSFNKANVNQNQPVVEEDRPASSKPSPPPVLDEENNHMPPAVSKTRIEKPRTAPSNHSVSERPKPIQAQTPTVELVKPKIYPEEIFRLIEDHIAKDQYGEVIRLCLRNHG